MLYPTELRGLALRVGPPEPDTSLLDLSSDTQVSVKPIFDTVNRIVQVHHARCPA